MLSGFVTNIYKICDKIQHQKQWRVLKLRSKTYRFFIFSGKLFPLRNIDFKAFYRYNLLNKEKFYGLNSFINIDLNNNQKRILIFVLELNAIDNATPTNQ